MRLKVVKVIHEKMIEGLGIQLPQLRRLVFKCSRLHDVIVQKSEHTSSHCLCQILICPRCRYTNFSDTLQFNEIWETITERGNSSTFY
jgi:hypothetical protein